MKLMVRAKRNVKDINGWHFTGSVFETEEDLGDAVEKLNAPKAVKREAVPAPAVEAEPEPEKPKTTSRRRKVSE